MHLDLAPGAALPLRYMNRHALITGATGTGKTVTLAAMVEGLDRAGVPVLVIDAKGDLESLGQVLCPYGKRGPRAPVDLYQMGPEIIARALDLSEAQAGAVYVLFEMAQAEGIKLADLDDLKRLSHLALADIRRVSASYGLISAPAIQAMQRALLRLDGGAFGRPGFDMAGRQGVTIWAAGRMARTPALYAAAVTWLLLDLYDRAAERGDAAKPALAVVIDESHLIFDGIPPTLQRRLEGMARLIRSKGIGLIWASQSPNDLPPSIAGQCITRIQHALRASTPAQLRDVRAAADSLPQPMEGFDAAAAILGMGVGDALISLPDATGTPQPCQLVRITPGRIKPRPRPVAPPSVAAWPTPAISPPGSGAAVIETAPWGLRESRSISPPGSGSAWGWWIHPLRFIGYTVALVAVMSFFG